MKMAVLVLVVVAAVVVGASRPGRRGGMTCSSRMPERAQNEREAIADY